MENGWIVIGIGGATCSGKTTLANELHAKLPESVLIHQDDYYFPMGSPNLEYIEEVKHYNWDVLSAIDVDRMLEDVKKIIRTPTIKRCFCLVEGHLIYNHSLLVPYFDYKFFFTVSKETARFRRSTRKYKRYDKRYFDDYSWALYEYHRDQAFNLYSDFIIMDGDKPVNTSFDIILSELKSLPNVELEPTLSQNNQPSL